MTEKQPPRTIFIIWSMLVGLCTPFVVFFLPLVISTVLYEQEQNIALFIPAVNFWVTAFGLALFLTGLLLLAWKRNKNMYGVFGSLLVVSLISLYASSLSYTAIQEDQMVLQKFNKTHIYPWEDMEKVEYVYVYGVNGTYYFTAKNGDKWSLAENGVLDTTAQSRFYSRLRTYEVELIEEEIVAD